jgi:putative transposase
VTENTFRRVGGSPAKEVLAGALPPDALDALVKDAYENNGSLGVQELLNQMTKAVLERSLEAEMSQHLGYEKGDPSGQGTGNSRNGRSVKTVSTSHGPVELDVLRDRNGTFEPAIVPKRSRRLGNIDDAILSLYSRGMTTRDIESHLRDVYGVNASRELISNVTDVVTDEIALWQARPLDEVYPILYVDGLRLRIKDKGVVTTKVAYLAVGVDLDGRKHALGLWIADTEAAKFWAKVVTDLRNRGVKDILIACCDGLTGLPDAIRSAFPEAVVQTCVVHVIRNAMRFISYGDRKKVTTAMRDIYTAPTLDAAQIALKNFDKQYGTQYPAAVQAWRHAWNDFIPFLDYPAELRRVVYTTNLIENINFQLRKITKNRGHENPLPWNPQHHQPPRRTIRNRNLGLETSTQHPRHPLPKPTTTPLK